MTRTEVKFHIDPSPGEGCIERIIIDTPIVMTGNKEYTLSREYKNGVLVKMFIDDGNDGSILPESVIKKHDLSHAEYRGRQSLYVIEKFCDGDNVLGGEDFPDEKPYPYQTAICSRTIHYWFKVTDLMWEHWVVK